MGIIGVCFLAISIGVLFKKKFEETIGISIIVSSFILYFLGLFLPLKAGVIVLCVIYMISLCFTLYSIVKNRIVLKDSFFSIGTVVFCFFVMFLAFYNIGRDFHHPDEFIMWGMLPKTFVYFGELFNDYTGSYIGGYPPLISLWLYFANITWGHFSSTMCLWAQGVMTISFVMPWFSLVGGTKKIYKAIILLLISFLLFSIRGLEGFSYILQDTSVAGELCLFVYGYFQFFEQKDSSKFYKIMIIVSLMYMALTKRIGIVIAVLALMCLWYSTDFRDDQHKKLCIISSACVFLTGLSWHRLSLFTLVPLIGTVGIVVFKLLLRRFGNWNSTERLLSIFIVVLLLGLLVSSIEFEKLFQLNHESELLLSLFREFFSMQLSIVKVENYISVPYMACPVLLFLFAYVIKKDYNDTFTYYSNMAIAIGIAEILYAFTMIFLYYKAISPGNGNSPFLEDRYFSPWLVVTCFVLILFFITHGKNSTLLSWLIILLMIMSVSDTKLVIGDFFNRWKDQGYNEFVDNDIELSTDNRVFFIDESPNYPLTYLEFMLDIIPAHTNYGLSSYYYGNMEFTADQLEDMLSSGNLGHKYDYVYIQSVEDNFIDRYGSLFDDVNDFSAGALYGVNSGNDGIKLKRIQK